MKAILRAVVCLCVVCVSALAGPSAAAKISEVRPPVTHSSFGKPDRPAVAEETLSGGDRLSAGEGGRALIEMPDGSKIQLREFSTVEIAPTAAGKPGIMVSLLRGAFYVFSRSGSREMQFRTPHAIGGVRGTEYELLVDEMATVLTLFDGAVELTTKDRATLVQSGKIAEISAGGDPVIRSIVSTNLAQWWLYYPAILDIRELDTSPAANAQWNASLSAWDRGNISEAWKLMPSNASKPSEQLFEAAIRLGIGQVAAAKKILLPLSAASPLAAAQLDLIQAVEGNASEENVQPQSATEWLARSYVLQSRLDLRGALSSARRASERDPQFGFAHARVAELEFSFGDHAAVHQDVRRAIELSPEYAPAYLLEGFFHAANNDMANAAVAFDRAFELDPFHPDVWLARGLLEFRKRSGDRAAGMEALKTAVALERNRSGLRTYLGKGYAEVGDATRAAAEFSLASSLDSRDPTPWLYSALTKYDANRVNAAIDDLERSLALNDQRAVYRSPLMLDEDRSLRATSLARLYQRAGFDEVALAQASIAVENDYSNPSAHLFIADAFNSLRDPTRFNLRYETAWFNEALLANALAPVDAGLLSPTLSQQEYYRLFLSEGFRTTGFSEARSDGQYRGIVTHSALFERTAYAIDMDWQVNSGVRPNNDLRRVEIYPQFKTQVTDADTLLVVTKLQDYSAGDNFQYRDPAQADPHFRFSEYQYPIAVGIWRHQWSPENTSLLMLGRLASDFQYSSESGVSALVLAHQGVFIANRSVLESPEVQVDYEAYVAEFAQITTLDSQTIAAGLRLQTGAFESADLLTLSDLSLSQRFGYPPNNGIIEKSSLHQTFDRVSPYIYDTFHLGGVDVTPGLTIDHFVYPANFRQPPLTRGGRQQDSVSPKLAAVWQARTNIAIRVMYAESIGGLIFDESYRFEPVQLAGFTQAYRSAIPESSVGAVSAARSRTTGAAVDFKFPWRGYLNINAMNLRSDADQTVGVFIGDPLVVSPSFRANPATQLLRYEENSAGATVSQLLGEYVSIISGYEFRRARLDTSLPIARADEVESADLHEGHFGAFVNLPSGWFFRGTGLAVWQEDRSDQSFRASHLQLDVQGGWRFPRQRGEISLGVMNLLGNDYRLAPLSGLPEMPRSRVVAGRVGFNF